MPTGGGCVLAVLLQLGTTGMNDLDMNGALLRMALKVLKDEWLHASNTSLALNGWANFLISFMAEGLEVA